VTGGADLEIFKQFTAYISHNYTGKLPLNDANDEFAAPYHLLHVKSEYKIIRTRSELLIFAGIDNLLDVKYSLGNDINAFGRRFYNTAAGINFYAGFSISLN
ncbi:MAG TPA: TonB-dependent receptor, partial [Parasegetibacter sp.]